MERCGRNNFLFERLTKIKIFLYTFIYNVIELMSRITKNEERRIMNSRAIDQL